ncbi:hypothetical protein P3X46_025754 [Hevea brasiliensis]|uniref:C3H1-type domain-containing protein n=1 Tax=Hevea brasiliensis TaxID=3981 RepID=A0ABQ9L7L8_HEVBR|nr:zinc finger CCCH domain-containing protein 29 [Hevea brasiliensis]KAJ9160343.1 hypothetical protein P3X46_025754 [Hevea brasiliensis]
MCSGSKGKLFPANPTMEVESGSPKYGILSKCSVLLELSASDDLVGFKSEIEEKGLDVDEASYWYGRRIGLKKMGFEERTPLMIAAMFGSTNVLKYIIGTGKVDVNRACGWDKVTALHCAVAGGSNSLVEIVKLLLDASADTNCIDANGNRPSDLFTPSLKSPCNSRRKLVELLLKGESLSEDEEEKLIMMSLPAKEGTEKKEYPIDVSLPDINNGIYGTDEFRMYCFKVKPCSRAYSHDWTECPFVHPGENARRRDPKKYPYSCVPCPEFRKGTCQKADSCEYAHGVFESWLHPAQYRTRLCKDETGCSRKVCFFAHKPEELRPVYASTGSAMPSPKSVSVSSMDTATLTPLSLGSPSLTLPTVSTPPMSPLAVASSSPKSGGLWQNKVNLNPPALQLPGSRLKTALCARDLDLEMELLGLENHISQLQQQQLMDEISGLSSPSCWSKDFNRIGDLKPTNLDDVFGSFDPSLLSPLQGMSLKSSTPTQLQSPTGLQIRQNMNQSRSSYPANLSSTSVRKPASYGFDSSAAVAAAVMNSRSSAFAKRSHSFIDRGAAGTNRLGITAAANSVSMVSSNLSDWSSPDGKLDWGVQGDELNKLKKSASFGFRNNNHTTAADLTLSNVNEPDVSWVNSLVKDVPTAGLGAEKQYNLSKGVHESLPPWMEQLYIEQEQIVA